MPKKSIAPYQVRLQEVAEKTARLVSWDFKLSAEDAQDLAQETCQEILQSTRHNPTLRRDFDREPWRLSAYVRTTMRHLVLRMLRRRTRTPRPTDGLLLDLLINSERSAEPSQLELGDARDLIEAVRAELRRGKHAERVLDRMIAGEPLPVGTRQTGEFRDGVRVLRQVATRVLVERFGADDAEEFVDAIRILRGAIVRTAAESARAEEARVGVKSLADAFRDRHGEVEYRRKVNALAPDTFEAHLLVQSFPAKEVVKRLASKGLEVPGGVPLPEELRVAQIQFYEQIWKLREAFADPMS